MRHIKITILVVALISFFVTACSSKETLVIGLWQSYKNKAVGKATMEFFKDKTCAIEDGGFRIGCTWTLLDDGRTKIEFGAFGVKSIGFATVKGDELQLLDKARGNDTFLRADSPSFRQAQADDAQRVERENEERARVARAQQDERDRVVRERQEKNRAQQEQNQAQQVRQRQIEENVNLFKIGLETYRKKNYDDAIPPWRKAADTGFAVAQNNLAWLYATSSDPRFIDATSAVRYAEAATQQQPQNWRHVGTLAAAYARSGNFGKAVQHAESAINLLRENTQLSSIEREKALADSKARLALYSSRQAFTQQ